MIELRKEINDMLKVHHPTVYYQQAPSKARFPYLTYEFLPSFTDGNQEMIPFDVDIWDENSDTTEIETLNNQVWKALDRYVHNDKKMQFSIYRESRQPIIDEAQPKLRRRKLSFIIRYFDKEI